MENVLLNFKMKVHRWMCLVLILTVIQTSCKKEQSSTLEYPTGSNENINDWMLDSLKRYYYWSESLSSNPDISIKPQVFFKSVLNPADRFSYVILPDDRSTFLPNNRNFGFDFIIVKEQSTGEVIGIVKLVYTDSPASRAGLKRGDYIRKINGHQLTEANAEALQQEILNGNHFTLELGELTDGAWSGIRLAEISTGVILDQREISKIIESNGRKIAYLYFQDFNPGLASSLNSTFTGFKDAGVSEFILDLRYNSGGQVAEAAGLCAMIARGVSYEKPFITYKGNKNGGTRTESFGSAATFDGTLNFNTLLQNNLGMNRVFVLGTAATASAAEVIVNNLKPYIQVVLIGETTRGKDEASFKIFDARSPKQIQWEMHPIIYKLYNASGSGGYNSGITPDIFVNELSSLPLQPLGTTTDPLVKAAVSMITGKTIDIKSALKRDHGGNLIIEKTLLDTRIEMADKSIVITHH